MISGCFFSKGCYNESTIQAEKPEWRNTMSKIICDVCGSAYADTASQCPICGTAKSENPSVVPATEENAAADSTYNFVKGGRFSKSNVRKRNNGKELPRKPVEKSQPASSMPPLIPSKAQDPAQPKNAKSEQPKPEPKEEPKNPKPKVEQKPKNPKPAADPSRGEKLTNIVLLAIVLILLAAVIYVGVYIVRNYKTLFPPATEPSTSQTEGNVTGGVRIPCVGITVPAIDHVETEENTVKLEFAFAPSTTTDDKRFVSSDPAIATVDRFGNLTVHASGEVTITVTCGDQTADLVLNCVYVDPNAPTEPSLPDAKLELVSKDLTFTEYGKEYQLYKGEIDPALIIFTSSDEKVVTVDATGKITIVGKGVVTITAQYGEQKVECIIRCNKVVVPSEIKYELKYTDVTIKVGERLTIQLLDKETGAPISGLSWYTSMEGYISLETTGTGVRVTGTAVTVGVKGVAYVRVMCDYEGETYTCIVRVKAAPTE
jgi:hypothetical protein